MTIHSIVDKYGFWCYTGRNLFYKFPELSFINTKEESHLSSAFFLIDTSKSEKILPEDALAEMVKISKKKVYIRISENIQSNIDVIVRNLIVGDLPSYLHFHGRYIAGDSITCPTVELLDGIMFGVHNNPEQHRDTLLKTLQSDPSLSTYSRIRPLDSYDDYEKVLDRSLIQSQFRLPSDSIHGLSHWKQVEAIGRRLSAFTKADMTVVSHFAYLHDSQRQNEDEDSGHGERASVYSEQLYKRGALKISKHQLSQLMHACTLHSDRNAKTDDATIATCWDADRLDLTRLGITPDPHVLLTEAGKRYKT